MSTVISWAETELTSANTNKDGTGTVGFIVQAPPDRAIYVDRIVPMPIGTNVATCLRIFVNNGRDHSQAANNTPVKEKTIAATTLDEAAAFTDESFSLDLWLPAGYRLTAAIGTAVAAGIKLTAICGRYQDLQSQP